jgi:ATP citrate (pro-S)-lyase
MSAKSIHEADGKALLSYWLPRSKTWCSDEPKTTFSAGTPRLASLTFEDGVDVQSVFAKAEEMYPWLTSEGARFVAKPDQLIKRRGKAGLLALNKTWAESKEWIAERAAKPVQVEHVVGVLR